MMQPAPATTGALSGGRTATRDEDSKLEDRRQPKYGEDNLDKNRKRKEIDREESVDTVASEKQNRADVAQPKDSGGAKVAESKPPSAGNETSTARAKKSAKATAEPSSVASPEGNASDDRKGQVDGADKSAATRTVGGRQFVRRGGSWVDVAYGSQMTTNVRRGSDQYRALVADEPGLRAVANQLGGDVIVVWKGRAYRIY